MKLTVDQIPLAGLKIAFDPKIDWVSELVRDSFPAENPDLESVHGKIDLHRIDQEININGSIRLSLHPHCDRCGEKFEYAFQTPLHIVLSPAIREAAPVKKYYKDKKKKNESDREDWVEEMTDEDLSGADDEGFFTYENGRFVLKDVLQECLVLQLPLKFLCAESCKGLCVQCGQNLNAGPCRCKPAVEIEEPKESVWDNLKNFGKVPPQPSGKKRRTQ